MSRSQQLYELQLVDLEIDRLTEELATVESRLGETEELLEARRRLDQARQHKRDLDKQLREVDLDNLTQREKIKPLETKLYGGTVRNPKELDDLNRQVQHYKADLRVIEDRELELMAAVEEAEAELKAAERTLAEVERAWQSDQQRLQAERARLTAELEAGRTRRAERASHLYPSDLDLYEVLWQSERRRAVSKVERGTCQVCRIAIPATDIRRARVPTELVRCSSCGRILYVV